MLWSYKGGANCDGSDIEACSRSPAHLAPRIHHRNISTTTEHTATDPRKTSMGMGLAQSVCAGIPVKLGVDACRHRWNASGTPYFENHQPPDHLSSPVCSGHRECGTSHSAEYGGSCKRKFDIAIKHRLEIWFTFHDIRNTLSATSTKVIQRTSSSRSARVASDR